MARTPTERSLKKQHWRHAAPGAIWYWCFISFLCLFFFYVLVINSTRTHFEIQKGFSLLPGKSLVTNFQNVLADANIPVWHRHPQQPDRLGLLGGPQRVLSRP